jgi:hypothetical protein
MSAHSDLVWILESVEHQECSDCNQVLYRLVGVSAQCDGCWQVCCAQPALLCGAGVTENFACSIVSTVNHPAHGPGMWLSQLPCGWRLGQLLLRFNPSLSSQQPTLKARSLAETGHICAVARQASHFAFRSTSRAQDKNRQNGRKGLRKGVCRYSGTHDTVLAR